MMVQTLEQLAKQKSCSTAQLALAWLCAQGTDIFPIPGTTKANHLEDNVAAFHIQLTQQDLFHLQSLAPPGSTAGERYPPLAMSWINH